MCVKIQENYSTEPQKYNQKKNNFRIKLEKRKLIKKKTVRKSHSRHGFLISWLGLVLARSTLGDLIVHLDQACQSDPHLEQRFVIPNCGLSGAGSWDVRNTALLLRRWLPLTRRPATST